VDVTNGPVIVNNPPRIDSTADCPETLVIVPVIEHGALALETSTPTAAVPPVTAPVTVNAEGLQFTKIAGLRFVPPVTAPMTATDAGFDVANSIPYAEVCVLDAAPTVPVTDSVPVDRNETALAAVFEVVPPTFPTTVKPPVPLTKTRMELVVVGCGTLPLIVNVPDEVEWNAPTLLLAVGVPARFPVSVADAVPANNQPATAAPPCPAVNVAAVTTTPLLSAKVPPTVPPLRCVVFNVPAPKLTVTSIVTVFPSAWTVSPETGTVANPSHVEVADHSPDATAHLVAIRCLPLR